MENEILKKLRRQRGWTLRQLADRMHSYPQQISKYELGQTALTFDWIKKFAEVFDVPSSMIMGEDSAKTQRFADNVTRKLGAAEHDYAAATLTGYEIPVCGNAAMDGKIDHIDAVTGMLDLRDIRNSFAAVVSGNSMEPRYRHGDYALVVRDEWPQPYQDCLIETVAGEGHIKIYIGHTDRKLTCEQLNPRRTWEMPMAEIKSIQLVRARWK